MTFTDKDYRAFGSLLYKSEEDTAWLADKSDLTASIQCVDGGFKVCLGVDVTSVWHDEEAFDCLYAFIEKDLDIAVEKVRAYLSASLPLVVHPESSDAYMLDISGTRYALWCEENALDAEASNWVFGRVTHDNNCYAITKPLNARYAALSATAYLISKQY